MGAFSVLYICSIVRPSKLHGYGCFSAEHVKKGQQVWIFNPDVDHVWELPWAKSWEWEHAYRSKMEGDRLILPRDNSAFINFSEIPSLIEGPILNGEPCLVAAVDLLYGDELTVGAETDADAELKLSLKAQSAHPGRKESSACSLEIPESAAGVLG